MKREIQSPGHRPFGEVREELWGIIENGDSTTCPCCSRAAAIRNRHLDFAKADTLIKFWANAGREWAEMKEAVPGLPGGEYGKLRLWGLMERAIGHRQDGSPRTGWWRVTDKGERWLRDEITVPEIARVFANRVIEFGGTEEWTIHDALGRTFDYREMMGQGTLG